MHKQQNVSWYLLHDLDLQEEKEKEEEKAEKEKKEEEGGREAGRQTVKHVFPNWRKFQETFSTSCKHVGKDFPKEKWRKTF